MMKCLRCGYCCFNLAVVIVDDPDLGITKGNLIIRDVSGPCKHLRGDKPGEYECSVHDEEWYEETPCFAHDQLGSSSDAPCRMGVYILSKQKGVVGC